MLILRFRKRKKGLMFSSIYNFLEYIFWILIILSMGSIWTRYGVLYENLGLMKAGIIVMSLILACIKFFIQGEKLSIYIVYWLLFFILCMIFYSFIHTDNSKAISSIFAPLICFLLFAGTIKTTGKLKEFGRKLIKLITIIASVSLVFYIFGSLSGVISPSGTVKFYWDWERSVSTYWGLYFEPQKISLFGYEGIRNCAIFAEAPMYVFLLSIALIFQELLMEPNRKVSFLLVVTLITTFSTTGYITIILLYGLKFMIPNMRKRNGFEIIRILFIPITIFTVMFLITNMVDSKSVTGSYSVRTDHMIGCFNVFIDTFPFGSGFGNKLNLFTQFRYKQGLSVGLPYFIAEGGVIAVLMILIPLLNYVMVVMKKKDWIKMIFPVVFLWLFMVTNVVYNSLLQWIVIDCLLIQYTLCMEENNVQTAKGLDLSMVKG